MNILITGATGFIGSKIVEKLLDLGHLPIIASRDVVRASLALGSKCKYVHWQNYDVEPEFNDETPKIDAVIHLAGENISTGRWNEKKKKKIYDSRIVGTKNLLFAIDKLNYQIKSFISTSAIGVYPSNIDEFITEDSGRGAGFLSDVCFDLEETVNSNRLFDRTCIIRVGVVVGRDGGALEKMLFPFKLGVGGPAGSGNQYMSWIHMDDLVNLYLEVLNNTEYKGVVNGTAPFPVTNREFSEVLADALGKNANFAVPKFALRIMLGEMSDLILESQKVIPTVAKKNRFHFQYPTAQLAIKQVLSKEL